MAHLLEGFQYWVSFSYVMGSLNPLFAITGVVLLILGVLGLSLY